VTTSNKLDPTTSSILLAKRLAFPSALDFPVNLNNPEQRKANYTARPNEQEPGAWQGSAILGTEKIRQDRNGQGNHPEYPSAARNCT
jgi:hypothetical protein